MIQNKKGVILKMARDFSEAVKVNSISEEYEIASKHKCDCGGQLKFNLQSLLENDGLFYDELHYICVECDKSYHFLFDINSFFGKWK